MATPRPLRHPPVNEAIIDFRIASDPAVTAERLKALRGQLPDYPKIDEKKELRAELRIEAGKVIPPALADLGFAGLHFANAERTRVVQFRPDGFTLNQLKPYVSADVLIPEALRLWETYRELVQPVAVTRVAFRYINSMTLKYGHMEDFGRFLTAAPRMPDGTPQAVSAFLSRIVAHDGDDVAIVTQKLENTAADKSTPVTIDVDVFSPNEHEPHSEALRDALTRLRVLKNQVFFGLLTDEAVRLFE